MKNFLLGCGLALLSTATYAQDELLSRLLENEDDRVDESALLELEEQPLDLQSVSRVELLRLPFLAPSQIENFLQARDRRSQWTSAEQALAALAVTGDTLIFCRKIFHLAPSEKIPVEINSRIRLVRPATRDDQWQGAAYRNYQRVRATVGALSAATLAERDPGEKRFDDLSLFALALPAQIGSTTLEFFAGDFFMEWGQGLALWGPYGQSTGASAIAPVRRQARGLRPYLSVDENFAFRGAALSINHKRLGMMIFSSWARLDATPQDSTTILLSDTGGLHRTSNELAKRDNATEEALGLGASFSGNRWRAGALWHQQKFDRLVQPASHPSNYFDFTGSQNRLLSLQGELSLASTLLAGEWAISENTGRAFQITFETEATGSMPVSLAGALWGYDKNFHSSRGRGFGAFTTLPQNENGKYLGLRLAPVHGVNVESYFQIRNFPWRTFTLPLPAATREWGLSIEWKKAPWHLRLRWRDRYREETVEALNNAGRSVLATQKRQSLSFEIRQSISRAVRLFTRLDVHSQNLRAPAQQAVEAPSSRPGFAISQEIGWQPLRKWGLYARLTIFESPAGEAIYIYERDLPGLITNFSLREQGERGYIYIVLQPAPGLQISAKASRIWRPVDQDATNGGFAWGAQADWQFRRPASEKRQPQRMESSR